MAEQVEGSHTLPQVAAAAEVEYRTLHTWLKRGLVRATRRVSSGSGTPNLFAPEDVLEVRILADLRRAGLDLRALERTAQALQGVGARLEGNELLVVNGSVEVLADREQLLPTLERPGPALVYNVAWARSALAQASAD